MNPSTTRRSVLQRGLKTGGALAAVSAFPGLLSKAPGQPSRSA